MNDRLRQLQAALERFEEVLALPVTDVVRDAAIQRFEFCFELSWKCAQLALRRAGQDCATPRSCLQAAYRAGWVEEAPWLEMLEDRNLSSHTYNEALAIELFGRLPAHLQAMKELAKEV